MGNAKDSGLPASGTATDRADHDLYLDLLKKCLTRSAFPERLRVVSPEGKISAALYRPLRRALAMANLELARRTEASSIEETEGRQWPVDAETMIGSARLDNLHRCVVDVITRGVTGDLVETGVWRGGATIFMRGVLAAYGVHDRKVWAADSFKGLPRPDPTRYPRDKGDEHWKQEQFLAVSLEEVKSNFRRYGLLDDQVRFLPGWFRDTLPSAPIDRIAVLRLDGDMYESTMEALDALYDKVSSGGYVIVDDYGAVPGCRTAVHEFRARRNIDETIEQIDWTGVYWQRR